MLVDSNVIIRTMQPRSPQIQSARAAIKAFKAHGRDLCLAPQNLVEIWAVATRPEGDNGLGMAIEQAAAELTRLKTLFTILSEKPLYDVWESLVMKHEVSGKQAHDARLVAAMRVHALIQS